VSLPYLCTDNWMEVCGIKQMAWASYLFYSLNNKIGPVTCLAPNMDEEIEERISASTGSYTMELNEDTFKADVVF